MKRSRIAGLVHVHGPALLLVAFGLIWGLAGAAGATQIQVTPSLLDLVSTTGKVDGRSLSGAALGDQFTLGYTVENPYEADVLDLFTSIVYDPSILRFVGGSAFPILEQTIPGTSFDRVLSLNPLANPAPRATSPEDTLIALTHAPPVPPPGENFLATNATGPDLAFVVTFEVLRPDQYTSIDMAFLPGDAAVVNGILYCGVGSGGGCDIFGDEIFQFKNFKVGPGSDGKGSLPIPEPSAAFLIGLGLVGLAGRSRRSRIEPWPGGRALR